MDQAFHQSPPAIHGEQQAGRAAEIRKQLMVMVEDIKERTFDLAEMLYVAKHEGLYRQWGYASIADYGSVELGLKESKTRYLTRIAETMDQCGIERSAYEQVGVSKLREISRLGPAGTYFNKGTEVLEPMLDHIVRLVKEAPQLTVSKINDEVNRLQGMVGENKMVLRTLSCTESAWKTIERAVELVRKKSGSKGRDSQGLAEEYSIGSCIEMIAADYLADPNNDDEEVSLVSEPDTENNFGDIPMESSI